MRAFTGARRLAGAAGRRALGAAQWLGLAEGGTARPATQRKRRPSWGYVPEPVRRAARWVLVRGLASAAFRPGRWGVGLAVAVLVATQTWWLASIGLAPLAVKSWVSRSCGAGILPILSTVSSRVQSLRLARRLRKGWPGKMHELGLARQRQRRGETVTLVPELERMQLGEFGVVAEVDLHRLGMILEDLSQHRKRLESVFLAQCSMHQRGYATAVVEFRHTDPLSRSVAVECLPVARRHLHVVTRVAENGRPVEQDVILPRLVIGGQGSGKSMELRAYLWALQQASIPFRLRVFDPKGGMELGDLREATHAYESRATGWADLIGIALDALASRQRSLAGRGWSKLVRFTEAEPLDILVVDELLTVVAQQNATVRAGRYAGMKAGDAWDQYLSQGRAAGYTAFALSQLSQKQLLGHARGLFPHLTMLRVPVTEKEMVDRLLGSAELYPAHLIPPGDRHAGIGYARTPEGQVVRSRGALLTTEQWRQVVAQIAEDKARRTAAKRQRESEPVGVG